MAVKIEKGGWALIFLIGLALFGYALNKYGIIDLPFLNGQPGTATTGGTLDTSRPLPDAPTGGETKNVRVRVNVWVGCAGGLVANGGLDTRPGSIYADQGLNVSFKIIDDWTEGATALATNNVDVMLTTADVWAKDYGQFLDKGFRARAVYLVDWSRGADGVIGRQGISNIEGLAGKKVAFAPYTPSHFLLWNGLRGSGLTTEQRKDIFANAVHTKDGIEPATLFAQQKVDAAVAWDPDMSDAVAKRPGSRKIYDTKTANRLIADVLVVSEKFAAANPGTLRKFLEGWMQGTEFIAKQPARAHTLIGTIKDFNIPADLAKTMLDGVRLADYADNKAFFTPTGGAESDYANILTQAQEMYREERLIKRSAPIAESFDRRYIDAMEGKFSATSSDAPIQYKQPAQGAAPFATQRRAIYFETNSAAISADSATIVEEIGNFLRSYENTVVDIEGNTDNTGGRDYNMELSRQRAESVKTYLTRKYGFPPTRLRALGNGPDKPIETNGTVEGRDRNRRTDIKVYTNN